MLPYDDDDEDDNEIGLNLNKNVDLHFVVQGLVLTYTHALSRCVVGQCSRPTRTDKTASAFGLRAFSPNLVS